MPEIRHLRNLFDVTSEEVREILNLSREIKHEFQMGVRQPRLAGFTIALLFEKPSLRTRVSFETGISQLGGGSIFLGSEVGWGQRESIQDFTEVTSRYVDAIVCRAYEQSTVENLVQYAHCSIINGLTDMYHPCQALADMLTVWEHFGDQPMGRIAFIGDANNVARSLALICCKLGVSFAIACPKKYQFERSFIAALQEINPNWHMLETEDPLQAVSGAIAVYTDVWVSMGQEEEQAQRVRDFAAYQVNERLMESADAEAIFLHCMPAHRDVEVTRNVFDGPQSRAYQQANNRMHAQKGLLCWLLGKDQPRT
jgi:ornithine carbamoyltransferase